MKIVLEPGEGIRYTFTPEGEVTIVDRGFHIRIDEPIAKSGGHMVNISREKQEFFLGFVANADD